MNGPQHYAEAENQLELISGRANVPAEEAKARMAKAQVHATLALVALLTETQIGPESKWDDIRHAWQREVRES